jgi:hypothetical protein
VARNEWRGFLRLSVVITLLACVATWPGILAQASQKSLKLGTGSISSRIEATATGQNGYEEDVRAADIADTPEFKLYDRWLQAQPTASPSGEDGRNDMERPAGVGPNDPDLVVRRKWVNRYRICLELVATGDSKRVFDPRKRINPETVFPEFSTFRTLIRLEMAAARVDFADGQTGEGIQRIEESLVFGQKISSTLLIGRLVGIATSSLAYRELDSHWPQLCLSDATELKNFFGARMNAPSSMIEAVNFERQLAQNAVELLFKDPAKFKTSIGVDDDKQGFLDGLSKMSADDLARTESATSATLDSYYTSLAKVLTGPESAWLGFKDVDDKLQSEAPNTSLSNRLAALILPTMSGAVLAEAKDRTRARLAYLTCRAIEYRWLNGKLPDRIEEFSTLAERRDPIAGINFNYRKEGIWFVITRSSNDAVGSVSLMPPPRTDQGNNVGQP